MAPTYQNAENNFQPRPTTPATFIRTLVAQNSETLGAAISTSFATVTMTAFLWSQIVSSLIQQTV